MAAKNLPPHHRKQAILWGTVGAIVLRLVMAVLFVEALNTIPALHLIGGLLLLWIGYSLLDDTKKEHSIEAKDNLRSAIMTIVIADGVMGIDNRCCWCCRRSHGLSGGGHVDNGADYYLGQYAIC
jgi:predicted tellurium resistance membrane protein TerC